MSETQNTKKLGYFSIATMYIAYCCSCTSIPNGGIIGEGSTFGTGLASILLGWLIGSIIVAGTTMSTYKTNTFKDIIWSNIFGKHGSRITSAMMAFCMSFWACFDFFNGGQSLYNLMPEGSMMKNLGFCICIIILVAVTIFGGVKGTSGVKIISNLTVPVAVILFVIIYIASVNAAGGMEALMAYQPAENTVTVIGGAQIMVGMWMGGFCGIMDLAPGAKNGKVVIVASICGVGFIMLCFLVGQVGFIGTELKTLGDICMSLGGGIFWVGNIFVIIAQGNTTPACNLMYSNSWQNTFRTKTRTPFAVVVPIIAAALAFMIMYGAGVDFINVITDTVSTVMAPLVGVTLASFWIVEKRNPVIKPVEELPGWKPIPIICLAIGVALSLCFRFVTIEGSAFIVVIVTGLVYAFWMKSTGKRAHHD